jgi:hypothetical protein
LLLAVCIKLGFAVVFYGPEVSAAEANGDASIGVNDCRK